MNIACNIDCFGADAAEGLRQARKIGATGVQLSAAGALEPGANAMTVAHVARAAKELGLEVAAVRLPLAGGLANSAQALAGIQAGVVLAAGLGCKLLSLQTGPLPRLQTGPEYQAMLETCRQAGAMAAEQECALALETGVTMTVRLKSFADQCGDGVGISYDPAGLVMYLSEDEVRGVYTCGSALSLVQVRDGVLLQYYGPERIYFAGQQGPQAAQKLSGYFRQEPVGGGTVRWLPTLAAMQEVGYEGWYVLDTPPDTDAAKGMKAALRFLQEQEAELAAQNPPEAEAE